MINRLLSVALAIAIAIAGLQSWRLAAEQVSHAQTRQEHADAVRAAAEAHAAAVQAARETERSLRNDIDRIAAAHEKEMVNARAESDRVIAALRSGNSRLSVAVRSCAVAHPGAAGAGSAPAGGHQSARAELDPAAAERIFGIARDGDDAIVALNACIGAYEAAQARINGASPP